VAKRDLPEEEPLNLVPMMNLVTILIPVLLAAIKSMELVIIDTSLPAIGTPSESTEPVTEEKPLELKLAITDKGMKILGAQEFLPDAGGDGKDGLTIPCKNNGECVKLEDYDWSELSKKLQTVKKSVVNTPRDADNVILIPESGVRYEVLVKAMDVTRKIDDAKSLTPSPKKGEKVPDDSNRLFPQVVLAGGAN